VTGVPVVNPAGAEAVTTREIVFVSPRDAGVSPARADLIAFGIAELVSEDVEIIGIEPGEGLTANLTGVRYVAPLLMEGETGDIPEIQTRLTRDRARTPPAPVLLGVTFEDTGIRVGFSMPPWRGAPITGFTARWRTKPGAGETVGWVDLPDLPAGAMILTTPAPRELPAETDNVTRVEIELRALTASGQASQALLLTAVQPVVAAPASGDWTVTLRFDLGVRTVDARLLRPRDAAGVRDHRPGLGRRILGGGDQPVAAGCSERSAGLRPVSDPGVGRRRRQRDQPDHL
jgi:hypothetical protein